MASHIKRFTEEVINETDDVETTASKILDFFNKDCTNKSRHSRTKVINPPPKNPPAARTASGATNSDKVNSGAEGGI